MVVHRDLHLLLVRHRLQIQVGTVSCNAEVGLASRDAGVAAIAKHKQRDGRSEPQAEKGPQGQW